MSWRSWVLSNRRHNSFGWAWWSAGSSPRARWCSTIALLTSSMWPVQSHPISRTAAKMISEIQRPGLGSRLQPDGLLEQWNHLTNVLHVACLPESCVKGSREVVEWKWSIGMRRGPQWQCLSVQRNSLIDVLWLTCLAELYFKGRCKVIQWAESTRIRGWSQPKGFSVEWNCFIKILQGICMISYLEGKREVDCRGLRWRRRLSASWCNVIASSRSLIFVVKLNQAGNWQGCSVSWITLDGGMVVAIAPLYVRKTPHQCQQYHNLCALARRLSKLDCSVWGGFTKYASWNSAIASLMSSMLPISRKRASRASDGSGREGGSRLSTSLDNASLMLCVRLKCVLWNYWGIEIDQEWGESRCSYKILW